MASNRASNNGCHIIVLVFTALIISFIVNCCLGWQKKYENHRLKSRSESSPYKRRTQGREFIGPLNEDDYEPHEGPRPRLVGGYPAPLQNIPSQFYMLKDRKFHCGGVLVEMLWVLFFLTAAHCVWQGTPKPGSPVAKERILMVGGDINIRYWSGYEQLRGTEYIVVHENYHPPLAHNDIAIIFPNKTLWRGANLNSIRLPPKNFSIPDFVQISGWGSLIFGSEFSHDLQKAVMPTLDWEHCKPFAKGYVLTPDQLCVGLGGFEGFLLGPCDGDSGGPAIGYDTNQDEEVLVGIISYGTSLVCGDPKAATVLTQVSPYLDWIEPHVKEYIKKYGTGPEQAWNETLYNHSMGWPGK